MTHEGSQSDSSLASRGHPIAARAFVIEDAERLLLPRRGPVDFIADIARHWRAGVLGALIVGGASVAWQVRNAGERQFVLLVESATLPAESGVQAITKHDLAAIINSMAVPTDSGGVLPPGATLDASVPKTGDLVRVTITLQSQASESLGDSAKAIASELSKRLGELFAPRVASAKAYLESQAEVTRQSITHLDALIAKESDATPPSDRSVLLAQLDQLRARGAATAVRASQLAGPSAVELPIEQEDPGTLRRVGLVAVAAGLGGLLSAALAALCGKVHSALARGT